MAESVRNIGPRERRRRLLTGVVMLAAGVALIGALAALGVGRGWRLLAALPFWAGMLGLFQAKEET
jgi:fatty acid desaturase